MAQDWYKRYPLVDGHGNVGSIDGDGAAAMRYTEARLDKNAMYLLQDLDKQTVDFVPNFDETEMEPTVLSGRFPNLLVNGAEGIAVGMTTNMPPHNINNVISAIKAWVNDNETDLVPYIQAPDFPTGGLIINAGDLRDVYETGTGRLYVRCRYNLEEKGKKTFVHFYESPYNISRSRVVENAIEKVNSKKLIGIKNIVDQSDKHGTKITFEIAKGFLPEAIIEEIYAKTDLQFTYSVFNTVIASGRPQTLSLTELVCHYMTFQRQVVTNRTLFEKSQKMKRLNIVEGLLIAVADIDNVIHMIKNSDNPLDAKEKLMANYGFNEAQAIAIINLKLSGLTKLESNSLVCEKGELLEKIGELDNILNNAEMLDQVIISELSEFENAKDIRRTAYIDSMTSSKKTDKSLLVPEEDVVVIVSEDDYVKRVSLDSFRTQNRGGQGVKNGEDNAKFTITSNTRNKLIVFNESGTMFSLPVCDIPSGKTIQKGISIYNLLSMTVGEKINFIVDASEISKPYILFVTEQGTVKKSSSDLYKRIRSNGQKGILINEGDKIKSIHFVNDTDNLFIATRLGKGISISTEQLRPCGRIAHGVRGIKVCYGDVVIDSVTFKDNDKYIAIFSEKGIGKKISIDDLRVQGRGGQGVTCLKPSDRTGGIAGALNVSDEDRILIVGNNTTIAIEASSMPVFSRTAAGNKMISNNIILSVTKA